MSQGIVAGFEEAFKQMTQWTVDQAHEMSAAIGPRQFGQEKLPERVQAQHAGLVHDDQQAWESMLQAHGWQGPGSPVPKNVIDYGQRVMRLSQKYPDEFQAGQRAYQGLSLLGGSQASPPAPVAPASAAPPPAQMPPSGGPEGVM